MAEPSPWVYTTVEVPDATPSAEPSKWVYVTVVVPQPHLPFMTKTADGHGWTRILTNTGSGLA